ncbi:hypothetical protein [Rossellomorea sp. NRS-1567]|uniref:hypothetical protein n=1 Tax=Rossellomorea sp. NRS-1567 TaxID=3233901 RepID=UPI003D2B8F6A
MKQLSSIQLQQQIIHYKSELEKYKQKCSLLERNSLVLQCKTLKKENQLLENTLEEYRMQIKKTEAEKEQISSKYQTFLKAQEKEMTKLRYTINQLKDQLHKTNQIHLTEKNKQTEHQNETKDAFEKKIISLQVTNCYLTKEIELLLINKQEIEKQLYRKESELLELGVSGEELQREWSAHKQHLLILNSCEEHKNYNLLNQNDSLKTHLYLRETELMELGEQLEKLKIEWAATKQHLLILHSFEEHKNHNLLDQIEALKAQLYLREIELYEVQQTFSESTFHYKDLLTIKANQLEQASKMQIEKSAYIQKIETSLKKQLDEKESYTNTLHALRKNIKLMKKDVFSFHEEESAAIKNKMKSYENTIQHLQFTNAQLIEEINKLKNRTSK